MNANLSVNVSSELKKLAASLKLTPLAVIIALFGLVAMAYIGVGVSFVRQRSDEKVLSSQVGMAEGVLVAAAGSGQQLDDLQSRLQIAQEQLAFAQAAFPSELDSSAVVETVLAYATASQARVLRATTKPPVVQTQGEGTYTVLSATFDIEGDLGQLISFLARLEGESLAPFGIKSLTVQEAAGGYALNIEVLAYARQPAEQATPASGSSKSSATPTPSTAGGGKTAGSGG
jgi:hypothetical protein